MSTEIPPVFTVDEVAKTLRTTEKAVLAEFESGRLRGFQIGGEWRTTLPDVLSLVGHQGPGHTSVPKNRSSSSASPVLHDFQFRWQQTEPFSHRWPSRIGEPESVEEYPEAFEGLVSKNGQIRRKKRLLIGFTTRQSIGMERRRATAFLTRTASRSQQPTLYPVVEFAGANDYATTRRLASVIKLPNRKQLKADEPIPPEYQGFETAVYSEVVTGPHASNGLAVVVRDDDLDSMARHALIRWNWGGSTRGDDFEF